MGYTKSLILVFSLKSKSNIGNSFLGRWPHSNYFQVLVEGTWYVMMSSFFLPPISTLSKFLVFFFLP
jgi:hypothetical protein